MEKDFHSSSFDFLQDSFANWDAGVPSENVWDELEADLATEAVWSKVSKSIETTVPPQTTFKQAFDEWDVAVENDGWSKLNDSLSRERVWVRLSSTLSIPVSLPTSYLKIAASFLIFMFTSFHVTNSSLDNRDLQVTNLEGKTPSTDVSMNQVISNDNITNTVSLENNTFENRSENNANRVDNNQIDSSLIAQVQNNLNTNNAEKSDQETNTNRTIDEFSIDPLFGLALNHSAEDIPAYDFNRAKEPSWFVSTGSQFALLREVKNGPLTSTVPRIGAIGEIGHTFNKNRFFMTQSLGFSQFTSEKGRYINGRYLTANQKLNVAQAKVQFGYSFNRIRFNVGVNANRIFSGYESQGQTISNVYDVPQIKLGFSGGFEVKLKTFKNKDIISVVTNYQFIPKLVSKNAEFESIEAINFQLKYAF